jgi:hypothetical protein
VRRGVSFGEWGKVSTLNEEVRSSMEEVMVERSMRLPLPIPRKYSTMLGYDVDVLTIDGTKARVEGSIHFYGLPHTNGRW